MLTSYTGLQVNPVDAFCVLDPYWSNVVLMAHMNGSNGGITFTDSSLSAHPLSANGNASTTTAVSKFNGSSGAFDGAADWVQTTVGMTDFRFGTGDFTVECFCKTTSTKPVLIDFYSPALVSWQLIIGYTTAHVLQWYVGSPQITVAQGTTTVNDGQWHHLAASRSGTTLRLFVDGILEAAVTDARNYNGAVTTFALGAQVFFRNATFDLNGNLAEVRITKGIARYLASFTPPTKPFCNYTGGSAPVAAPAPAPIPQPPITSPITFSATAVATLSGLVGTAISSTTLATITCSDASMTIVTSSTVPGLTFSYTANVLTVSGTPTAPGQNHRVVVSYIASDGSYSIRGSTTHTVSIQDPAVLLTIGANANYSGQVGVPVNMTLCTMSLAANEDVQLITDRSLPGLTATLAWTRGATSTGTLTLSGTPTARIYAQNALMTYVKPGGGVIVIGTSVHNIEAVPAYTAPPAAPAPTPAPSPPSPTAPAPPAATPAPGKGGDPYQSTNKALLHFDAATGLLTDVKGSTWVNGATAVTSTSGLVAEGGLFANGAGMLTSNLAGIDGSDGNLAVDAWVNIDATCWAALADDSNGRDRFCPIVTAMSATRSDVLWSLGIGSWRVARAGSATLTDRVVVPLLWQALTAPRATGTGFVANVVSSLGPTMPSRPGRFVGLAAGRKVYSGTQFLQALWQDAFPGLYSENSLIANLPTSAASFLQLGGVVSRIEYVSNSPTVDQVRFSGVLDEVRVNSAARYGSYIATPSSSSLWDSERVTPWPNY